MNKFKLYDYIPSITLKEKVKALHFELSDFYLFKILYLYAKTIDERIAVARYFLNESSDQEVKDIALSLFDNLTEGYHDFIQSEDNTVFDLHIKEWGCSPDTYLDSTFNESISKAHDIILCNYVDDGYDPSDLDIYIVKRKIGVKFNNNSANDIVEIMYLNEKCQPDSLFFMNNKHWVDDNSIFCDKYWWDEEKLPHFFNKFDLVKLDYQKEVSLDNLGVVFHNQDDYKEPIAYVTPLNIDLNDEKERAYHEHISFAELTVVDLAKVDPIIKESYEKFIEFFNKLEEND